MGHGPAFVGALGILLKKVNKIIKGKEAV